MTMRKRTFLGASLFAGLAGLSPAAVTAAPKTGRGEILWDSYGVPHVYGKDEAAVFYGFGWAQAQNHGDIVVHLYGESGGGRRSTGGRSSPTATAGCSPTTCRPGRWPGTGPRPPQFRRNLDAFAQGINDYAKANPGKIDPKIAVVLPVSGIDVMAHSHG